MQLHSLGKVCLPTTVLVIRRGDNCDLIQIVLKTGEEPAHEDTMEVRTRFSVYWARFDVREQTTQTTHESQGERSLACSAHWLLH